MTTLREHCDPPATLSVASLTVKVDEEDHSHDMADVRTQALFPQALLVNVRDHRALFLFRVVLAEASLSVRG
jgi:hypothetical protein